jgi:hypothetical protein
LGGADRRETDVLIAGNILVIKRREERELGWVDDRGREHSWVDEREKKTAWVELMTEE